MSKRGEQLEDAWVVARNARVLFGEEAQDMMIIEEFGELLTAIARRERGRATERDVEEEIADCILVLLGASNLEVFRIIESKKDRLMSIIAAKEAGQ